MSRASTANLSMTGRVSRTFEVACTTLIAWSFAIVSAAALSLIGYKIWHGDFKSATPFSVAPASFGVGLENPQPWGLTFSGQYAMILAGAEALGVMLAMGMSMMFASGPRRLGLMLMVCWSGLWAADAVILLAKSWDHGWWHASIQFLAATLALFVIVAAMAHRASRLWRIPVSV